MAVNTPALSPLLLLFARRLAAAPIAGHETARLGDTDCDLHSSDALGRWHPVSYQVAPAAFVPTPRRGTWWHGRHCISGRSFFRNHLRRPARPRSSLIKPLAGSRTPCGTYRSGRYCLYGSSLDLSNRAVACATVGPSKPSDPPAGGRCAPPLFMYQSSFPLGRRIVNLVQHPAYRP
jgi:hypothetical protein